MHPRTFPRGHRALRLAAGWIAFALAALVSHAQSTVSYTGGTYTQDFNSLPNAGTFTFASSGPFDLSAAPTNAANATGWYHARVGGSGSVALFFFGTGSSTTGGVYSFGGSGSTERALGTLQSGTNVATIGAVLVNNTAVTITQFTLGYTGEQWRKGGSAAQDKIAFEYKVGGTGIADASGFTAASALDFSGPIFNAGSGALDGNAVANRSAVSSTVTGLTWNPGQTLVIRWTDLNVSGSDDGLAIDDVSFTTPVGTGPTPPAVISTVPANGAINVSTTASLNVTFNQAVNITGTWFTITGSVSGAHVATVSGGPSAFTLSPTTPFVGGETVTLTVFASQVTEQAGGTLHPTADFTASFTALSSLPLAVHTVQGSGSTSTYATQVVTVEGIVVASFQGSGKIGGYYIEAPTADHDGDPSTSEGIYVFDNANSVSVGDKVSVTGTVTEFGTAPNSETEISPVSSFAKISTGNPLPAATEVSLPFPNTGYAERYEGMLVTFPQKLTVTDNFDYGHFGELLLSNGRLPTPTNIVAPGAPAQAQEAANLLNQVLLDDGSSTTYPDPTPFLTSSDPTTATRRAGSTTTGVTGAFANKFGAYVIEPTGAPAFADENPRGPAPVSAGTLRVVIGNVENFMNGDGMGGGFPTSRGADTLAEYQRQLPKVTAAILALAPDIMGLTEIENDRISNGATDSYGPTSAIAQLVASLNASAPAGTTYAFVNASAVDITTDLIHVALIYRTETVETVGAPAMLSSAAFNNLARNPLAQTFRQKSTGEKLTVCINHFRAKASAAAGAGNADSGDGQGTNNALRVQEADALTAWLATFPTGDTDPDILIIGDLNAYAKEDPITHLIGAGYTSLTERFEGVGGWSYAFGGEFGHLDHALATLSLNAQTASTATWHVNSDEPVFYDYNLENKTSVAMQAINAGTAYRYSDHDPVVIGFNLGGGATQTFAAWAAAKGLAPGQDGPTQDPDADGISNLLEYFLGLEPLASNPAGLPVGKIEGANLAFRFPRSKTITGVSYRVVSSTDLVTWTPVSPDPAIESSTADADNYLVTLPLTSPKLFVRLEVTQ